MSYQLPETGYLRIPQIIGDPNADPPIPAIIPVGKSTWWDGVKSGRFPKSVKLGPRTTACRVEDIRAWIEHPNFSNTTREALIYSVSGYNTDHHSQLHGDLGNASTNAR